VTPSKHFYSIALTRPKRRLRVFVEIENSAPPPGYKGFTLVAYFPTI
jgi:hypothetical protein